MSVQIVRVGWRGLVERSLHGVRGAERFLSAVLTGDLADRETVERRRSECRSCASRVRLTISGASSPSDWCGTPLTATETTCGCLCAGKTVVGSEKCPQGRW